MRCLQNKPLIRLIAFGLWGIAASILTWKSARADEQKLLASQQNSFGYGVGMAVSGGILFVGANEGPGESGGGYVDLYERDLSAWIFATTIIPTESTNLFGYSMAIDGDWLVIGGVPATDGPW